MKKNILSTTATLFAAITLTLTACSAPKGGGSGNTEPILAETSENTESDLSYSLSTEAEPITSPSETASPTASAETALFGAETEVHGTAEIADERFRILEDAEIDLKTMEQISGEELQSKDFTDCSAGVLDSCHIKIYGYLSGEDTEELIGSIRNARISSEEYGALPLTGTGGNPGIFKITLNTNEVICVGTSYYKEDCMLTINGRNYLCDEESVGRIRNLYTKTAEKLYPYNIAESDLSYSLSTDPTETVKAYCQEKEKQDYVLEFELRSVETDQAEADRICSLYRDSDLAHERGWENEIFDENRFTVVSADYYAKYDGTLVPYSGGEITEKLWLIQDAETLKWQIVEIGN